MKLFEHFLSKKLLILILFFAAILRLWNLAGVPPALSPDEASLGYNAYSILSTGRDEYGKFFPVIFKSFGDYKPGFYVYLTAPFVAVFGLNEWSVRLPSAISGVVAVYFIYLLVLGLVSNKKLLMANDQWLNKKSKILTINHQLLAIVASLLLAINPWHIFFSRGAWEANVSLTLTLAGIYFFLKSLSTHKQLFFSFLFFALTLTTYQGAKLSTALVVLTLVLVYFKDFKQILISSRRTVIGSLVVAFLISLPVVFSLFQGQTGRLKVFSVFSYPRPTEYLQHFLDEGNETKGSLTYFLFHSEPLNFFRGVSGRWFNHFSGKFLFFEGDYQNPRHSAPNHGMLLLSDMVFLLAGFVFLLRSQISRTTKLFILIWLLLAPFPAALSRDQVQSVRSLNMVIPLTAVSAMGVNYLILIIKKAKFRVVYGSLLSVGCFLVFAYFIDSYFIHYPFHNAKYLPYGYKEIVNVVSQKQGLYSKVVFQQSYSQPYIYFLFYQKYNPKKYQATAKLADGGIDVGLVNKLDNIEFVDFSWPYATGEKNTLIVGNDIAVPLDFSANSYNLVTEIKYPDGFMTAFRVVETR